MSHFGNLGQELAQGFTHRGVVTLGVPSTYRPVGTEPDAESSCAIYADLLESAKLPKTQVWFSGRLCHGGWLYTKTRLANPAFH